MDNKLYALMNWPEIEAIVYSEHDLPKQVLGQHVTKEGLLFQAFSPTAKSISVINTTTEAAYPMEKVDEAGYFAALIPGKRPIKYVYEITYDNDTTARVGDPYGFDTIMEPEDINKFTAGIHYEIYKYLGAHVMEINGVKGVYFALWAPEAVRVSVVGDFCLWDGRRYPMQRLGDSGIHELFIPGLEAGITYKYEIKVKHTDTVVLKSDPYGTRSELRPDNASIVCDINGYQWKDQKWLAKREEQDTKNTPMLIYEVHMAGFRKPEDPEQPFYNYRELAPMICGYVKEMGYTHVELMPIMEHPLDASWGYQVTGYYAPTSRYGTPEDFMYFMDYMHQHDIGVILDWVPAHFPRDLFGLARFDGSCVYEHQDPRQGAHPHWGTLIFNYGRPQVSNFLIANALYWVEQFHADGIRMDAVASMLYLDYGKNDGEWVANIYGGNENLEAIEFLKHLNSIMKKRNPSVISIAEESTAWPKITYPTEDGGLGFDYKWNMGWMNDFTNYMRLDPIFRKDHYNELLFSMVYTYSENFVLVLSHDEVVHGKGTIIGKMPGTTEAKFANLRVAYGFMAAHPGKKLLFMGQEYGQFLEFDENKGLNWADLEVPAHKQTQTYVKDLNKLYQANPAFYQYDYEEKGFEWINNFSAEESIVVFLRKTEIEDETLLIVCNFTPVVRPNHKIGVPFAGKYKEIFNSDAEIYGGQGNVNPRLKQSKKEECDERENSIKIIVPPLGITVFKCTKVAPAAVKAKSSPAKKTVKAQGKETAAKKPEKKKPAAKQGETPVKTEVKKLTTAKTETKKLATAKTEPKKLETAKTEAKKLATTKTEAKKLATTKTEAKKLATAKTEAKKLATTKTEAKKLTTTKTEPKKLTSAKAEDQQTETRKTGA